VRPAEHPYLLAMLTRTGGVESLACDSPPVRHKFKTKPSSVTLRVYPGGDKVGPATISIFSSHFGRSIAMGL
jgi:hypothetical protein